MTTARFAVMHQPSLPLSLADGTPPHTCRSRSPVRRRVSSRIEDDDDHVPRWQRELFDNLGNSGGSRSSLSRASQNSRSRSVSTSSSVIHNGIDSLLGASPTPSDSVSNTENLFEDSILNKILTEVQASNKKVAALEKQVKELKEGECSNAGKKKKVAPSPEVRMMVRKVYKTFEDDDENFGWNFDVTFGHAENQEICKKIVSEAKSHLLDISSVTIRDAVRTYFNSIANVNCLKANGKYEEKVKRQRKRNRLSNKLRRRLTA